MYSRLYYQYSHVACPGTGEDVDNCAAPWECAYKGRCRMIFERRLEAPKYIEFDDPGSAG